MDKKRSIKTAVMRRFIISLFKIWAALLAIEIFLSMVTLDTKWDFSERLFSSGHRYMAIQVILTAAWLAINAAVYFVGIRSFGKDIGKKLEAPVRYMSEGFRAVTNGNLDTVLNFETETEFKEMRDSFNLMVRRLKESEAKRLEMENERMRLFSLIAHDLKTPMTTITGYAGALAEGLVDAEEKKREYCLAIKSKSEQVNKLTDQLLSYSKLGTSQYKLNLVSTELAELLRAACAALFGEMEKKRMELDLVLPDEPVYRRVDALEINRAVYNLLNNAIRHNPTGSLLRAALMVEPNRAVIQIADNGPPIPEAIAKDLFEPFISGDASRRSGSGTGLGLAIVKRIMEQHSGEVGVRQANAPYTKAFTLNFKE